MSDGSQFITKDSGKRREFPTGSVRDSREGKGRFDLIPPGPLRRLAQAYERGARKYAEHNWEKGQPVSSYLDSLERHANDYKDGENTEDHLAAIVFNAFGIMFVEEKAGKTLPAELLDLPRYQQQPVIPQTNFIPKDVPAEPEPVILSFAEAARQVPALTVS